MTDRELMQQALEALETLMIERGSVYHKAIIALRKRLAQPEQEPVAWADMAVRGEDKGLSWTPGHFHKTPLYTEPPKKEWVGLTVLEVYECWKTGDVVEAVEAKLKEKNHG